MEFVNGDCRGNRVARRRAVSLRSVLICATITLTLVSASACSSSSTKGSSPTKNSSGSTAASTAATASDASAAKARMTPYLSTPSSIGINVPLTHAPAKGIRVAYVNSSVGGAELINPFFMAAGKALGWKPEVISYTGGDPQSVNAAVEQAIAHKDKYIAIEGVSSAEYTQGLADAKAAGIGVIENDLQPEPDAASKGIIACTGCTGIVDGPYHKVLNDWTIADSNGNANVVYVGIPEFPVNQFLISFDKNYYKTNCSKCTYSVLNESVTALSGGQISASIIAYLQSHPSVNYIDCFFGTMCTGLRQAMNSAGIGKKVKLETLVPDLSALQGLLDKSFSATLPNSPLGEGYRMIDAMARASLGMSLDPANNTPYFTILWTQENAPSDPNAALNWPGPSDAPAQFKKLWKVS